MVPLLISLVLPLVNAMPSPSVPEKVPSFSIPMPVSERRAVFPLITPVDLFFIVKAEESSLTKTPFSKPMTFPSLLKVPTIELIFTAFPEVDDMAASASFTISTGWAPVLTSRPLPLPEILPLLVSDEILIPLSVTAGVSSAEEIVTSLLMTYWVSAEKFCGTEVD
ncbi:hypothetical protein AB7Z85_09680 [Pseudenterobacter timonensis]|uniref:Secreted protein n=1 Tax=Pseudenterobacter timonensis TaxID=1755099 RepID=A0ABV4A5H2_9ENTR